MSAPAADHRELGKQDARSWYVLAVVAVLLSATVLRFFNLNWDSGTHIHPDERYLTMVVSAVRLPSETQSILSPASEGQAAPKGWPEALQLYWDTGHSPLNPANYERFVNYVYGTLPLFATRATALWVDRWACVSQPSLGGGVVPRLLTGSSHPCAPGFFTGYEGIHLVGRCLAALADLGTLVAVMLMARLVASTVSTERSASRWMSLIVGMLYTCTVLAVQYAHFFVVDSFATVFVTATLLFIIYALRTGKAGWMVAAGLMAGLAVASKISVWPLGLLLTLAGLWLLKDARNLPRDTAFLVVAALAGAVAFRTAQPYAFEGPGFFDVKLNPQWLETMRSIRDLMRGQQDVPFGHQWTGRAPIIFPLRNMIFWGMGIPLGIASWMGWAVVGWRLWSRRQHPGARGAERSLWLLWIWGGGFFLYQGTQWVKSMRYLLPVYPVFVIFAGWLLLQLRVRDSSSRHPVLQPLLRATPALVVLGTGVWCFAFLNVYARPLTRLAASEWMRLHIPAAVNLRTASGELIPLPVSRAELNATGASIVLHLDALPHTGERLSAASEGVQVVAVELPKVGARGIEGIRHIQVTLNGFKGEGSVALAAGNTTRLSARLSFPVPVTLRPDSPIDMVITLLSGDPVTLDTSVIANEHWDDPLPLRLAGWDPFRDWYRGLESSPSGLMNNYDNDTLEKRRQLLNWLDEADYIVLSSNRLFASIPRLPMRYPLTTAYYQALFNGTLGFELEAEFVSYPTIGPCQFPDQEMPFPVPAPRFTTARPCEIRLPPAEEAFSVYDHPTVLVFKKTPSYSYERAREILPVSLLDHVRWMTPREATRTGGRDPASKLLASPRIRAEQEAGGTWSELFDRSALQNRSQRAAIVVWALMLTVLGWLAYPWLFRAFPNLHLHGYGVARAVGLLVWSYVPWLLSSLHILPHSRGLLWAVFFALLLLSVWAAYRQRASLGKLLSQEWHAFLVVDALFLGLYLVWVGVRWLNPDLWHPVTGGEKPMDFAYLNAVIKSTWFPPYDPWFAGGNLNYYYFGFVMIGSLVKALGIIPSIAYNLAVPSLFALTGLGAYTVASNLASGDRQRGMRAGLWATLLVLIAGNLGEVQLLVKGLAQVGGIQFDSLIPGYPMMVSAMVGLWKVLFHGASLPFRPEWWYWNASRIIPVKPGEVGPINEFPAFTFLYADLHAHMMAMPLVYVSLAIALQWALGQYVARVDERRGMWRWLPRPAMTLPLASLVAGALRATNTWDYPTALALMSVGYWLGGLERLLPPLRKPQGGALGTRGGPLLAWVATPLLLLVGAELAFRPYTAAYVGVYAAFDWWTGSRTPLGTYLLMYGQFLFPIGVAAAAGLWHWARTKHGPDARGLGVAEDLGLETGAVPQTSTEGMWKQALVLVATVLGMLVVGVIFVGYLRVPIAWLLVPLGTVAAAFVLRRDGPIRQRVLWFWVGAAVALSLLVEIAVLKGDIGRMNTVFKFHLEVWALLGVSAAVFAEQLFHGGSCVKATSQQQLGHRVPRSLSHVGGIHALPDRMREWAGVVLGLLLMGALLYPAFAIPWKVMDRWAPQAPHTLDGMAFMAYALQYENDHAIPLIADYHVIRWLQDHVPGSPTIIEAQASREYLWGNRVSIYTGLPSVVGWRWHQVQQRMALPAGTVEGRQHDVRFFYDTSDPALALEILNRYQVQYVILTPYERAYMLPQGLQKFDAMVAQGWLRPVYQDEWSTIYRVRHASGTQ